MVFIYSQSLERKFDKNIKTRKTVYEPKLEKHSKAIKMTRETKTDGNKDVTGKFYFVRSVGKMQMCPLF